MQRTYETVEREKKPCPLSVLVFWKGRVVEKNVANLFLRENDCENNVLHEKKKRNKKRRKRERERGGKKWRVKPVVSERKAWDRKIWDMFQYFGK